MNLTVLGSDGSWAGPGGACSGYLVRQGGFALWLDAGNGTLARLQEHIGIPEIGAVAITHDHPDHFVDLYTLLVAIHYGGVGRPGLPVFAPSGFFDELKSLMSDDTRRAMNETFAAKEIGPGESLEAGPFGIKTFEMEHFGDALGYRVEAGGTVLAYTGDTGPSDQVVELGRNADLFVVEASWQDDDELLPFHMSARQAGEHAQRAGASTLMLTHLTPKLDPAVSIAQAKEAFDGEILVAEADSTVEIG
ncbi:MAG: MBL fold metallo-hydrolase [Actinomycetota bacterium]